MCVGKYVPALFWLSFYTILRTLSRKNNKCKPLAKNIFFAGLYLEVNSLALQLRHVPRADNFLTPFLNNFNNLALEIKTWYVQEFCLPPTLKWLMKRYSIFGSNLVVHKFEKICNAAIVTCDCKFILVFDENNEYEFMSRLDDYMDRPNYLCYVKKPKLFHERFETDKEHRAYFFQKFLIFRAYSFNQRNTNFLKNCRGKLKKPCYHCKKNKKLMLRWDKDQEIVIQLK